MKRLNEDMDAQRWAKEFMALIENKDFTFIDEGLMIAWFANAIMCGHDNARWKLKPEAEHLRMQIGYIATELMLAGDKRSMPEIVEAAAAATAPKPEAVSA